MGKITVLARALLALGLTLGIFFADIRVEAHGDAEEQEPSFLTPLGALHPVVVHFPIALLLAATLSEGLLIVSRRESFSETTRFLVALGAAGAIAAAALGWIAAGVEAASMHPEQASLLEWHRWAGLATAGISLVVLLLSERASRRPSTRAALRTALVMAALAVGTAGYLGGEIVHGGTHGSEGAAR